MEELFESIKRGLEDAIAHSKEDKNSVRLSTPEQVDVKQADTNCLESDR